MRGDEMIHVSDLIHYKKCKKYCWNCKNNPKAHEGFYHMHEPFSNLWMEYLKIKDCAKGSVGDSNEKTLELLKEHDVVCFARFEYRTCRTKIPVLVKVKGGYRAIYPHLSAYPKESESLTMKINQEIAKHLGILIVENLVLYLNKDYLREDMLDLDQLLLVSDSLFNKRNKQSKTIKECMERHTFDLDAWIDEVNKLVNLESYEMDRNKQCTAQRRCMYYADCFDESKEPDDSVLFLTTSRNKLEQYELGKKRICDLDIEMIEGFRLQYAQYMASKNGLFMDKAAISTWLKGMQYPISYLDFEWDTFAIPPYKGMKVFDVLCFLYSLHVEDEDHSLTHHDFFATADCREAFIQSLIKTLPTTGSILVYNMEGAEKLRLKQLAVQFPKYKEALDAICDRMIDLSKPFECGLFYDNRMRGHYSLKNVLPVFTDQVSYQQLSIQDGLDAVFTYRTFDSSDEQTQKEIRSKLRDYCKMDTFAEYVILHGLQRYCKEEEDA